MLVRLQKGLSPAELDGILASCKEWGLDGRLLDGGGQILELSGAPAPETRSRLEDLCGVAQVLDASDAPELHARTPDRPPTRVEVGRACFGGGRASLIAGPCAVEDEESLVEIARAVARAGATCLRGGAFKPRTSPWSFRGLGGRGLAMLERAREESGLAIVTEVLDPRDVERVGRVADVFQIGSRSMANAALLSEVGRAGKPVLLKRGMAATAREFLLAAEYVLAAGEQRVVLCERGVRGFDQITRNLLDVGAIAWLRRTTHLPVIADPSHAAGRADLVRPLARAAVAAGADGLLVEVHPRRSETHSDGAQAVSPEEFAAIAADARALVELDGRGLDRDGERPSDSPPPTKSGRAGYALAAEESNA